VKLKDPIPEAIALYASLGFRLVEPKGRTIRTNIVRERSGAAMNTALLSPEELAAYEAAHEEARQILGAARPPLTFTVEERAQIEATEDLDCTVGIPGDYT
jgi:hypothetical protein